MRPDELSMFQRLDHKVSANKWFLPLIWTSDILKQGLEEGRLRPQCVTSMLLEAWVNILPNASHLKLGIFHKILHLLLRSW